MVSRGARTKSGPAAFRFIDLFAGIGGLRRAFDPRGGGGRSDYTSERDRFARQTYLVNYRCDHEIAGDIRDVSVEDIPEHDVLLAGFPCQPFSIAAVSKRNALNSPHGFLGPAQGTAFFDVERIIEAHRPSSFLLEFGNVVVPHRVIAVARHMAPWLGFSEASAMKYRQPRLPLMRRESPAC